MSIRLSIPPTPNELYDVQSSIDYMSRQERHELSLDLTDFASDIAERYPVAARAVMDLAYLAGS